MDDQKAVLRERLLSAVFPVETLDAALPHLRRPFAVDAVKWKVQSVWPRVTEKDAPEGCMVVAYIDARLVFERLNTVVGAQWSHRFVPVSDPKHLMCELTLFGVVRPDLGQSSKGLSKDLVSDALKRAGVPFGVGLSVYALPRVRMTIADARNRIKIQGRGERRTIVLTDYGHETLAVGYRKWLETIGEPGFGPVLDHGDARGAFGEEEVPGGDEEPDVAAETPLAVPERLTDDMATQLRDDIESAYVELRGFSKRRLLAAEFQAQLIGASGSHEGLREMLVRVQDLVAEERAKATAGAAA